MKKIAAVSADGLTLTLDEPLEYTHLGVTITLADGTQFEGRAEVGLLTRNIVVRGSQHAEWDETIEACPDGFNTGNVFCLLICIIDMICCTSHVLHFIITFTDCYSKF